MDERRVGLCVGCRHVRALRSARGSTFILCTRHDRDPRFAKYPRLPVLQCSGFEPETARARDPQ